MVLWQEFVRCVACLRTACRRKRTSMWLAVVLIAWAARPDLLGVTSLVRASFLQEGCYHLLLNFFHSGAVVLPLLIQAWIRLALTLFEPVSETGYTILVADGLKVAKEGKKMPGVKSLHQESTDNSKAEFIMGHSIQVISLLVTATTGQVFAVPLMARICEGLLWGRAHDAKSLLDKLVDMFIEVAGVVKKPMLLVADAYYASAKIIVPLLQKGHVLITRVRRNAVAFEAASQPKKRKRGRPKKYGRKVQLRQLFKAASTFIEAPSPVYGEKGVAIKYRCVDLLWRPVGQIVRFVLVKHPTRGMLVLLCSNVEIDPLSIIRIYGLRFKIEVSFKHALHTLGAYGYHFWMKLMKPIKRGSGDQGLKNTPEEYKQAVARKLAAYHRYIQLACILQGLLQHLAINFRVEVWAQFRSWLRTMKPHLVPSEMVVAQALKTGLPDFLMDTTTEPAIKKFILDRAEIDRMPGLTAEAA
jgi:hypothetical protein